MRSKVSISWVYAISLLQVASWGADDKNMLPDVLMKVELPIISNTRCRVDTIAFTGDPTIATSLTSNVFCAGHDKNTPEKGMIFPTENPFYSLN